MTIKFVLYHHKNLPFTNYAIDCSSTLSAKMKTAALWSSHPQALSA